MRKRMILMAALAALAWMLPMAGASANGAVVIPFSKQVVSAGETTVWSGTAGAGTIMTALSSDDIRAVGPVWRVSFIRWVVTDSGTDCDDFTADVRGTLSTTTGRVSLNGTVTSGDCAGSGIHVQARLDLTDFSSEGRMRITP